MLSNYLYLISFIVGAESGLAMVAAPDERTAKQTLRNSGKWNGVTGAYEIIDCRNIGVTACMETDLLLESYVNAMTAFNAIISSMNKYIGPTGEKGKTGDTGPIPFTAVNVSVDDTIGTPSVGTELVGTVGDNASLNLSFHGLKGQPGASIRSVEQTVEASTDGGVNELTVILEDGTESKVRIRNGHVGLTSVDATVDSLPGTPSVVPNFSNGVLHLSFFGLKGIQGEPGRNNTSMTIVDSLPDSSTWSTDKIYLLYNNTTGKYDIYFLEGEGSSYTYVQAGSLEINLSDYKRKDSEVWLTREEFDALPVKDITKTYNIYEEADDIEVMGTETSSGSGAFSSSSGGTGSGYLSQTA